MILWTDNCITGAPAAESPRIDRPTVAKICWRCRGPFRIPAPLPPATWTPRLCRGCRLREDLADLALRLICAAGSAIVVFGLVWAWLWLGGAR